MSLVRPLASARRVQDIIPACGRHRCTTLPYRLPWQSQPPGSWLQLPSRRADMIEWGDNGDDTRESPPFGGSNDSASQNFSTDGSSRSSICVEHGADVGGTENVSTARHKRLGGTINFQLEERTDSSSSHTVDGRPSTSRRTETISETVRATLALGKAEATGTYTLTVVEQRSEASSCLGRANNRSNSRSSGPPRPLKSAHLPGR
jgi:hypothetical protein